MDETMIQTLLEAAKEARLKAYAPYSHFKVGASVLGSDGKVYSGCNIENASYGLTICAERTAIFKMVSEGCQTFEALCVISGNEEPGESGPCGACRQVIAEFAKDVNTTPIIHAGQNGSYETYPVIEIYPKPFMKFVPSQD